MPAAERTRWGLAVGLLLVGAFLLRIWGIKHGLPYAYNADENAHFVPKAIQLFGHGWNPHYFVNPPAYTYLLHIVFAVWFGGREGVSNTFATNQTEVFVVARVTAAVVGTLAVWLLYLAGARAFDRRVGLLAAGLLAVAFLPVLYSHLALNDVPTLAPICLSLWGTAGVLRSGRLGHYALAGVGLGLACATKYTGGVVVLPLLAACAVQLVEPAGRRRALEGLALAGALAIAAFFVANPYAFLDHAAFHRGLRHQSAAADDALGKLGLTQRSGTAYYLWTFTWGLGFVPLFAAVVAAGVLAFKDRAALAVLAPAPLLFVVFMGSQSRFFGRWLMPVLPIMCILGAYVVVWAVDALGARRPALRPALLALGVVALCGQGLVYSLHEGLVLSRPDTRNLARAWMVAHVPSHSRIVVEPVVPDSWAQDLGHPSPLTANGDRWAKFPTSRTNVAHDGTITLGAGAIVNIEDYERALRPALIDLYEQKGYCYVVSGSTQRGRAEAQPRAVPQAVAYYAELERRADKVAEFSPYRSGHGPVEFNFDWTFDYYPLAYRRPGPVMTVYRLRAGLCAGVS
jgi:4-amino-4-deoxy-L-arabinose transferase-like glycosyltransferase